MKRVVGATYRTTISAAFDLLPEWLADELRGTHFLCGVDPLFVGLHGTDTTTDGRSYRDTAHVNYGFFASHRPASDRATTVALPIPVEPWVVVHELGHVVHELLRWAPSPDPVTKYAATNRWESFAEAFTMAHVPGYASWDSSRRRLARYLQRQPDLAPYFMAAS